MEKENIMKTYTSWLLAGLFCSTALWQTSCTENTSDAGYINLPEAVSFEQAASGKGFVLEHCKGIACDRKDSLLSAKAEWLASEITASTGLRLPLVETGGQEDGLICLAYSKDLPSEGFQVKVEENRVRIEAADASGLFYGGQWLLQSLALQDAGYAWPACAVKDFPQLQYRGAMLDVSRNFFSVEEVKRFIDMLAVHRLNYFHWHLTDDQGWRIEISEYPRLTEIGAWRGEGSQKTGGFYTQDEIREVVRYAAAQRITVVPEIDLPGHSSAVLAAYPELGCTGGPYRVAMESGGVHKDVLCLGNEKAYQFAREVLKEVAALFPSSYVHIGGDEVPRTRWEACPKCQKAIARYGLKDTEGHSAEDLLQGEFNRQMAGYLKTLGKKMVGWDEVLSDNIDRETVVMSWRGLERGIKALKAGHPVIFSSNGHFYFNNYQVEDVTNEPVATGSLVEMQKVYEADWNAAALPAGERERILGAEACLWTSYVDNEEILEYMMLPRLAAFAEVAWTGDRRGDYTDFLNRLPQMLRLYQKMGWNVAPHYFKVEAGYSSSMEKKQLEIELKSLKDAEIYYTLDGTAPLKASLKYVQPVGLSEDARLTAVAYLPCGLVSDTFRTEIKISKASFCPIELRTSPSERYPGEGGRVLVDGARSKAFHTTGMWVGYFGEPMDVVVDLGTSQQCAQVVVSSLTDMGAYIMGIQRLEVQVSADGKDFVKVGEREFPEPPVQMEGKRTDCLKVDFTPVEARYVRVIGQGFPALPSWHSGAGETPFVFVDEVSVY